MNYNTHGDLQYKKALVKYEELVTKFYKEPEDGKFEDVTDEGLEGMKKIQMKKKKSKINEVLH